MAIVYIMLCAQNELLGGGVSSECENIKWKPACGYKSEQHHNLSQTVTYFD